MHFCLFICLFFCFVRMTSPRFFLQVSTAYVFFCKVVVLNYPFLVGILEGVQSFFSLIFFIFIKIFVESYVNHGYCHCPTVTPTLKSNSKWTYISNRSHTKLRWSMSHNKGALYCCVMWSTQIHMASHLLSYPTFSQNLTLVATVKALARLCRYSYTPAITV